jgi:hypothetical protein
MKIISLTRGQFTVVDDEDFKYLNQWNWYCSDTGYAVRTAYFRDAENKRIKHRVYMHRLILRIRRSTCDHINGDRLDNRKYNLRKCSKTENNRNSSGKPNTRQHRYKGIYKNHRKWYFQISKNGNKQIGGGFNTDIEAAKAYDNVALAWYGEFAKLNFPRTPLPISCRISWESVLKPELRQPHKMMVENRTGPD